MLQDYRYVLYGQYRPKRSDFWYHLWGDHGCQSIRVLRPVGPEDIIDRDGETHELLRNAVGGHYVRLYEPA